MKKVEVFKFNYEIEGKEQNWEAYIAAYSGEEARRFLQNFIKGRIRITAMTTVSRLDAITDDVRKVIAAPLLGRADEKKTSTRPKKRKRSVVPKG